MAGLEDSLRSALDYESEVAYIALTSPVPHTITDSNDSDEFDFSMTQDPESYSPVGGEGEEREREGGRVGWKEKDGEDGEVKVNLKPPLLSKTSSARPLEAAGGNKEREQGGTSEHIKMSPPSQQKPQRSPAKKSPVSPLVLEVPHYTLDTDIPTTPTSKLRRIKEAQALPSPRPRPKLEQSQHLYCVMVVYGSSGCGRTHLVEKLVHSNPSLFAKVISSTTRRRRANEVSGVDFHYISHKEMALGVARGDFIESVRVFRRGGGRKERSELRRKAIAQASVLEMSPPTPGDTTHPTTPPISPPTPPGTPPNRDRKYGSLFDLTAEDSPSVGGETFGTTYQSLTAAIQQGKPCILLNVSTRGAQQLKTSELNASYILVHNTGTPKGRHASRIERNKESHKDDGTTLEPDYTICSDSLDQAYSDLHHYALQLMGTLQSPSTSQYQVAQYEWETLPTVQFETSRTAPQKKLVEVTFSELLAHFHNTNLKPQMQRAKTEHSRPTIFPLTRLSKKLRSEKLLVQALSYCQLNEKDRVHLRMLQTLYSKLTGNSLTCRRIGSHWQEIGFTGVDPADDLQTVGLLGLTQLIYFLENPRTARFCKEIFQYCHRDTHVIPFAVLSLEFSQLALQALDSGCLNKLCNKRDQVFVLVNEFYMAAFHHYYQSWKSGQKSILQLGLLMQECGDYCKKHPRQVMQDFDKHLSIREPQNQLLPALVPKVEGFTPFESITTSN